MENLIPENSDNLPEDILEYINSVFNVEDEDEDNDFVKILLEEIKACGGFRFLPDNLKKELIKFSKCLPEKEEAVFRLYFGIAYDDENIAIKHLIEQNLTIEQFEKLKKKAIERRRENLKDEDSK